MTWLAALLLAIGAAVIGLVVARELSPRESIAHLEQLGPFAYTRGHNMVVLGLLCLVAAVTLTLRALRSSPSVTASHQVPKGDQASVRAAAPGRPRSRFAMRALLAVGLSVGGLAYFYGERGIGWNYYPGLWDALHYGVGAKYHAELGYRGLYDCVVQADAESGHVLPRDLMIRDLNDYRLVPARAAVARGDCRGRFGAHRWSAFKRDLKPLLLYGRGIMPEALRDHGYNGTPLRSLLGGGVVPMPELSFRNLSLLTLLDVLALTAMLVTVVLSFGARLGAVFALFVFVNFSDRFAHIGGSQLRYLWLSLLVIGLCMLKRERPASAGVALTTSAMLNVFPAVFLVGPLLRLACARLRGDAPTRAQKRFAGAVASSGLGLLGLTLAQPEGPARHLDFLRKMGMHAPLDNNARVGLRYLLSPVTETPTEPIASSAALGESALLSGIFVGVAVVAVMAALAVVARLDDVEASALGGMVLLFVPLGTVQYYYACACVLVLLLHRSYDLPQGRRLLALLFGLQAGIYLLWALGVPMPVCDHVATSWAYAAFLGAALVSLGRRPRVAAPAAVWAA